MYVEELKDAREWDAFLQHSPGSTFYHSLEWKEVIQKSFPHSALYLTIKDTHGTVVGICPGFILGSMNTRIYYSIPYSDYGGPVIAGHCVRQASLLLRSFLEDFCSNNGIAYAKICFIDDKSRRFFESPIGCIEASRGIVEIDFNATSSDFIWKKLFSKNRRWKIRRLERDGFQAQEARTKSDLRDFYNLYYTNMRYIGALPYPYEFIENMWSILYPDNLRIWLVGKKKRIGGIAVLKYGRRTYWVYAGIDRKIEYSRYSIVPYLLWKEIEKAEEEGYRYVSLGGTPSDPNSPLYLQKRSFGGLFHQQETVWYPFTSTGSILLQTRAKTISAWKTIRNALPIDLKRIVESKLSRF